MARSIRHGLGTLLLILAAGNALADGPKCVLLLDPYGRDVAPFSSVVSEFRTTLARELGEPVDFYELPLDLARFSGPEGEAPLAAFLESRLKSRPVDLVVTIGSAGVQFAARHREQLFPDTPVLVVAAEPRMLPAGFLETNATLVTQIIRLPGMVEDILQLQPRTTNIVVVFGASKIENAWVGECRREFQSFTNRLGFTWINNVSAGQMLERCADLPPHSFIFLGLFVSDAAGIPSEKDEALLRLHATANAPVFSFFASQFGSGPVGGRLYQDAKVGEDAARVAIRILHGEKPENIPPQMVEASAPVYDWRELQRWGINEANLPAGSVITFRKPTLWQQFRWHITGVLVFCGLQTFLIVKLFFATLARKRTVVQLRESEERLKLAAEAAGFGVWIWNITSNQIWGSDRWRRLFGFTSDEEIGFERVFQRVHPEDRESLRKEVQSAAANENELLREYRLTLPDGTRRWVASRGRMHADRVGKPDRMFGATIDITERKLAEEKMGQLSQSMDQSPVLVMITDLQGNITYVNRKFSEVTGYSFAESIGQNPRILKSGESPPSIYKELWACLTSGKTWQGEFHNRKKNGELYWEAAIISPLLDNAGKASHFVAVKEDITGRKQTEAEMHDLSRRLLRAHEAERARLGRELHDDVTQRLAILAIDAGRVERGADKDVTMETMRGIREGLVRLSEDIHALSYRLHPSILEDLGLSAAMRAECERFARQGTIATEVKLRDLPNRIPPEMSLCLFRVAQEALRNVARHSQARRVEVVVRPVNGHLQLVVQDDGVGFDPAAQRKRPSLGLASMRERVLLLDGELDIESAPGQGTTIMVTVPIKKAEG